MIPSQSQTYTMTGTLPNPDTQAEFYAGVPFKRLLAWIVDVILVFVATLIVGLFTFGIGWLLFPLFFLGIDLAYRWMTIGSGSATLGMRLMAIEIRNGHGARLDGSEALLHTLAYMGCAAFAIPQVISIVMMGFGGRSQGLHDLFLGTAAINRPG